MLGQAGSDKFLVYASSFAPKEKRLRPVSAAAEKMARLLNAAVEVRTFRKRFTPIYVYYQCGPDEPIPIYCTNDEESDSSVVCAALRDMMFVLSFHPKHSALKRLRKEIMQLS